MIGLQAFFMLTGGVWCAILGAVLGSRFGFVFLIAGGIAGFVVGVFTGALLHECGEAIIERAQLARESNRNFRFNILLAAYLGFWAAILALFFYSLGLVAMVGER